MSENKREDTAELIYCPEEVFIIDPTVLLRFLFSLCQVARFAATEYISLSVSVV